jgi:hypothetical protein
LEVIRVKANLVRPENYTADQIPLGMERAGSNLVYCNVELLANNPIDAVEGENIAEP